MNYYMYRDEHDLLCCVATPGILPTDDSSPYWQVSEEEGNAYIDENPDWCIWDDDGSWYCEQGYDTTGLY